MKREIKEVAVIGCVEGDEVFYSLEDKHERRSFPQVGHTNESRKRRKEMKFVMLAMNNEKQAHIQGVIFTCGISHGGIMGRCLHQGTLLVI